MLGKYSFKKRILFKILYSHRILFMDNRLDEIFSSYSGSPNELIPLLQEVQEKAGYLSDEAMEKIAKFLKMSKSKVFGVASFYAQFRFEPKGNKHIMLCRGTACHVKGAPKIHDEFQRKLGIELGQTTEDLEYSLESVACIGCCALAPAVTVNDEVHGKMTTKKVSKILNEEGK